MALQTERSRSWWKHIHQLERVAAEKNIAPIAEPSSTVLTDVSTTTDIIEVESTETLGEPQAPTTLQAAVLATDAEHEQQVDQGARF